MEDIDTGTPDLLASRQGRVLVLTMNRPASRNALSLAMVEALQQQLAMAAADDRVGCIVLTGASGAFCAGGDVKAMAASDAVQTHADKVRQQRDVHRSTSGMLFSMSKPTIAAVNGAAAGAGLSLALACDLRTMSSETLMMTAFAKVGLPGDFGLTYFLTQVAGTAKARELFYLSDRIPAAEALRLGLTNWVFKPSVLMDETMALASRIASGPSVALGLMKENLNHALLGTPEECLNLEATHHIHCTTTHDHQEATAAFVEKRTPVFEGR